MPDGGERTGDVGRARGRPAAGADRAGRSPRRIAVALAALAIASSALVALASLAEGCGGAREPRPRATVPSNPAAAADIAEIREAWGDLSERSRDELRLKIERFLERHPNDGAAPLARVYLTFFHLDDGDLAGADRELAALDRLPPGSTRDFADVARAEALRLHGRPVEAFEKMRPLAGKLVDPDARERFLEEVTLDAIAARRDYEAIAYMDAWVRNANEDNRDHARSVVAAALQKLPPEVLEGTLRAMRASSGTAGYGAEIQKMIAARLAQVAVDRGDTRLAQWLVDPDAGAAVLGVDAGLVVGELATRNHGITEVHGRTIGLILPTGSSELRDTAAEITRGVAWALDMPRTTPGAGDETRLVTRDDGGRLDRIESVLEDVAGDGAAVIIAGFEPAAADRATLWAERSLVPVISLAAPRAARPSSWAFSIGTADEVVLGALVDALAARRESKVAVVSDDLTLPDVSRVFASRPKMTTFQPASCDLDLPHAGESHFPLAAWERAGFRTWLVSGPAPCAREVLREVGALRGGLVALTLDATGRYDEGIASRLISAAAGLIPVVAPARETQRQRGAKPAAPAAPAPAALDPDVQRFIASFGATPTWETALGRDAAMIARSAVARLPLDATDVLAEVARRRQLARDAVLAARPRLWTTEASAIDPASHRLPRTIRVVDLPSR